MPIEEEQDTLPMQALKGRKLVDIFTLSEFNQEHELYFGECIIVLEGDVAIEMPYGPSDVVYITDVPEGAVSEFADLSDFPVYNLTRLNELNLTVEDLGKIIEQHFQEKKPLPESFRGAVTFAERKVKYLQGRTITDVIQYRDDNIETAFLELDNGFVFGQLRCTQPGTGYPGPVIYESVAALEKRYGKDYSRIA